MPFNYEEYQAKCNTLSTEQLQKEWENYTRQIAGGATSTATSVLFSPLTAGISLVGLGLSAPRIHNARKKREIIEKGLQARGSTHNTRSRDVAGSMAVSGVIAGLTLGLASPGADIIAGEAVGKGVEYAAAHVVLDGAGAVVEHKHDGHLKKKGEQAIHVKNMQMQLNQYQQQSVQGPGQQFQSIQGVQMQLGYQQPGMPNNMMQLPQAGILMQNQQQIQWQQQPGLQIPGYQQPAMLAPGQYAPVQVPPRPHSAAPNNQYQYGPPSGPPPQMQPQQGNYQMITVQNPVNNQQPQQYVQESYQDQKTPAYTTSMDNQSAITPLPLYSQQAPSAPVEVEKQGHPTHIDIPEGPSMEEEIALLKARLLQMELEKRGMSATISGPGEITLDGPDLTPKEKEEKEPSVAVHEILPPQNDGSQTYEHPHLHVDTRVPQHVQPVVQQQRRDTLTIPAAQDQRPASPSVPQQQQYSQPPPASSHHQTQQYQTPPPLERQDTNRQAQQTASPPPASPHPQSQQYQTPSQQVQNSNSNLQTQLYTSPIQEQQQYVPPPATPPPAAQQNQYQAPPPANYVPPQQQQYQAPPPANAPTTQQQTATIYQPQPVPAQAPPPQQYQQQAQPQQYQQQTYQKPIEHIQRQDSGYYSQASTPLQRPASVISSISSISSPMNRHNSIASYTPGGHPQPQQYNPSQPTSPPQQQAQYQQPQYTSQNVQTPQPYNPQAQPQYHARSQSVASPPPPPYFPPPSNGTQPNLAGKDYFNQGIGNNNSHPAFPNYSQASVTAGHRGSMIAMPTQGQQMQQGQGMQGWQWGVPNQNMNQGMGMNQHMNMGMQQQQQQMMQPQMQPQIQRQEPVYGAVPIPGAWKGS